MTQKNLAKAQDNAWFREFVSECVEEINEAGKKARWGLIEAYHAVGVKIILKAQEKSIPLSQFIPQVMAMLDKGDRTIRYCYQLATKHPKLNSHAVGQMEAALIQDYGNTGKELTWRWITNRYLPEAYKEPGKSFTEHEHEWIEFCRVCHLKRSGE